MLNEMQVRKTEADKGYNYLNYFNALMLDEKKGVIVSDTEMLVDGKKIYFTLESMLHYKDLLGYEYLADAELLKQSLKPDNVVILMLARTLSDDGGIAWVLGGSVLHTELQSDVIFVLGLNVLTNEDIENL